MMRRQCLLILMILAMAISSAGDEVAAGWFRHCRRPRLQRRRCEKKKLCCPTQPRRVVSCENQDVDCLTAQVAVFQDSDGNCLMATYVGINCQNEDSFSHDSVCDEVVGGCEQDPCMCSGEVPSGHEEVPAPTYNRTMKGLRHRAHTARVLAGSQKYLTGVAKENWDSETHIVKINGRLVVLYWFTQGERHIGIGMEAEIGNTDPDIKVVKKQPIKGKPGKERSWSIIAEKTTDSGVKEGRHYLVIMKQR